MNAWRYTGQPKQDWPEWVEGEIVNGLSMRLGPEGGPHVKAGEWIVFDGATTAVYSNEEMRRWRGA